MRFPILFLILLLPAPAAAGARPAQPGADTQIICVSGPQWRPTYEESLRISETPVPQTYRALVEAKHPCTEWESNRRLLADWHLRFGDETSAVSALAHIEREYLETMESPEQYVVRLRSAYRAALPHLRRAGRLKEPEELDYSVRSRFMENSRPIGKLRDLIRSRRNHLFLAEQYLKAAEEFGSPVLLAKADLYLRSSQESAEFLEPLAETPPSSFLNIDVDQFRLDDFRARAAVARARISRRSGDIESARALLDSQDDGSYRELAGAAYGEGSRFCDLEDGDDDAAPLKETCKRNDETQEKVVNHWISRANLDLLAAAEARVESKQHPREWFQSVAMATRLLGFEEAPEHSNRCCYRPASEDRRRLLLAKADYYVRRLRDAGPEQDAWDRHENWVGALGSLREAERLAPPFQAPGRFTRIAAQWLDLWNAADSLIGPPKEFERELRRPEDRRFAEYLAANLRHLAADRPAAR